MTPAHFSFACHTVSPVLIPYFFAGSFLASTIPCLWSVSPHTAMGTSLHRGLDRHSTDAKKLFKSQCSIHRDSFSIKITAVFVLHINASCTTRNKTACKANKSVEAYNATKAVGAAKTYNAAKADNPDKPENSPVFPLSPQKLRRQTVSLLSYITRGIFPFGKS